MLILFYFLLLIFPSYQVEPSKIIIIYFSRPGENANVGNVEIGNTKMIVSYIKELYNDLSEFEIIPETQYPESYDATVTIARNQSNHEERPPLLQNLTDISNYDTILLGYPIWFQRLPCVVKTQLDILKSQFKGKIIYPFITHEGSGFGMSIDEIMVFAPNAKIKEGFSLRGTEARNETYHENIKNWLKKININKTVKSSYIQSSKLLLLFILLIV